MTPPDEPFCPKCGGGLIWVYVPDERRGAYLRDFTRFALVCEDCGVEVEP